MSGMGFDRWMAAVNKIVEDTCGLTTDDLSDYGYRTAYDDGCSPKEVAQAVLDENGWSDEDF